MKEGTEQVIQLLAAYNSALSNILNANELLSSTSQFKQALTDAALRDQIGMNIEALKIIAKELGEAVEKVR